MAEPNPLFRVAQVADGRRVGTWWAPTFEEARTLLTDLLLARAMRSPDLEYQATYLDGAVDAEGLTFEQAATGAPLLTFHDEAYYVTRVTS